MTGLTRQQAAKAVADLFGTSTRRTFESTIYDPWEVIDREGKKWRFVFDSSIKATKRIHGHQIPVDIGLYKVEMNSPKLEYSEMGKLQEVVRTLRHAGAVVNGSCGMMEPCSLFLKKWRIRSSGKRIPSLSCKRQRGRMNTGS